MQWKLPMLAVTSSPDMYTDDVTSNGEAAAYRPCAELLSYTVYGGVYGVCGADVCGCEAAQCPGCAAASSRLRAALSP